MSECRNCGNEVDFIGLMGDGLRCPACGFETTEEAAADFTDEGMLFNIMP
ncbi:MAG: hypothetical protein PHQ00_05460 [Phycisphaerae bacterium]|nr:hypothetical protein [Phycisphaerae bacterium]